MLSRIAESLFWIGRYIERADDTARILDVQTQLVLEDGTVDEAQTCRDLLSCMGVEPEDAEKFGIDLFGAVTIEQVLRLLAYDPASPSSIAGTIVAARESARGARETLTVPLWEVINTTWRPIPTGHFETLRPPNVFQWVRERAALISGTADATMARDEGWQFIQLGRSIERADMTSRLVATTAMSTGAGQWTSALRACGAYDAFLRTYRGVETEQAAAEFLLLDRLSPRSVVFALTRAQFALEGIDPQPPRAGIQDEASRLIGRIKSGLEYRSLSDVVDDLPHEMERLQRTCAAATDAISRRYFAGAEALAWKGVGV